MRETVAAAMREAPGSVRDLAREAGISEATLRQARDGNIRLTSKTVRKIIRALRRWSHTTDELADELEQALKREEEQR